MGAGQSTAAEKAAEAAKKAAEAAEKAAEAAKKAAEKAAEAAKKAAKKAVEDEIAVLNTKIEDFTTGPFSNMLNCILRKEQQEILIANLEAKKAKLQEKLEQYKSDL